MRRFQKRFGKDSAAAMVKAANNLTCRGVDDTASLV